MGAQPPLDHGGDTSALGSRSESDYAVLGRFSRGGAIHGRRMPVSWKLDQVARCRYRAQGEGSSTK